MKIIFAIHDQGLEPGAIPVPRAREKFLNEKGYGIFWTVNSFKSLSRKEDNVESLDCFYADIDCKNGTTKEEAKKVIELSPISPSMVVETKNGYHVYWEFRQQVMNPTEEDIIFYKDFLRHVIVPTLGADRSATDIARLLRVPGFNHLKDPENPFLVKIVFSDGPKYSFASFKILFQKKIDNAIKLIPSKTIEETTLPKQQTVGGNFVVNGESISLATEDENFWEKANNLNIETCLRKLNGSQIVSGDKYGLSRPDKMGRQRIFCNSKASNAWIDKNGKIGSTSNGGPTIVNWLMWYGHQKKDVAKIIKEMLIN